MLWVLFRREYKWCSHWSFMVQNTVTDSWIWCLAVTAQHFDKYFRHRVHFTTASNFLGRTWICTSSTDARCFSCASHNDLDWYSYCFRLVSKSWRWDLQPHRVSIALFIKSSCSIRRQCCICLLHIGPCHNKCYSQLLAVCIWSSWWIRTTTNPHQ